VPSTGSVAPPPPRGEPELTSLDRVLAAVAWLLPLAALALAAPALWRTTPLAGSPAAEEAARRALAQANRLVRDGELEAAVAAYAAGWSDEAAAGRAGDVAGVLAYNLGTTLHRLDRRPEALLWYRRAERLRRGDRWLADNLALVRAELAAPTQPPPGPLPRLAAHRPALTIAAIATAWLSLALLALRPTLARRTPHRPPTLTTTALTLALLSLLLWTAPAAAARWSPKPAILLEPCGDEQALPAGTELWVHPTPSSSSPLAAHGNVCPPDAIALIDPQR
jgi:hypothetical protein